MAKVGQMCDHCNQGIVRLNEHNVPHCDNVRCKIPHVPSTEPVIVGGETGAILSGTGVLCREHED